MTGVGIHPLLRVGLLDRQSQWSLRSPDDVRRMCAGVRQRDQWETVHGPVHGTFRDDGQNVRVIVHGTFRDDGQHLHVSVHGNLRDDVQLVHVSLHAMFRDVSQCFAAFCDVLR